MRIALLQQNFLVGDLKGNTQKIIDFYGQASQAGVELVVSSELALFGYPPKDLLERPDCLNLHQQCLKQLCSRIGEVGLIIGAVGENHGAGKPLFNSSILIQNGRIRRRWHKALLPTYDVFDERRYFEPGRKSPFTFEYLDEDLAMLLCEDIWSGTETAPGQRLYQRDPIAELKKKVPGILIVPNGSPYYWGKGKVRFELVSNIARRLNCTVVYVNQVGGNDDLVFDGRSFVVNPEGKCLGFIPPFIEGWIIVDTENYSSIYYPSDEGDDEQLYRALALGVRDYFRKTGRQKAVIGLSGGIDSAVTACIAVEALGKENVMGLSMPSQFSSKTSVEDAALLTQNLDIGFRVIPIEKIYESFGSSLEPFIGWNMPGTKKGDTTEENIQARIRGAILMAYSNRNGHLVLSTGNKSEIAVGYCTLYGDMVGGYAVLSDIPKTLVYQLANHINRKQITIPQRVIDKPPSAELRPDQKDQDDLPSYEVLDAILHAYVEEQQGMEEIVRELGLEESLVRQVVSRVDHNEYKRRQMAPGPKVTSKAFGIGRRMPIAAHFL